MNFDCFYVILQVNFTCGREVDRVYIYERDPTTVQEYVEQQTADAVHRRQKVLKSSTRKHKEDPIPPSVTMKITPSKCHVISAWCSLTTPCSFLKSQVSDHSKAGPQKDYLESKNVDKHVENDLKVDVDRNIREEEIESETSSIKVQTKNGETNQVGDKNIKNTTSKATEVVCVGSIIKDTDSNSSDKLCNLGKDTVGSRVVQWKVSSDNLVEDGTDTDDGDWSDDESVGGDTTCEETEPSDDEFEIVFE